MGISINGPSGIDTASIIDQLTQLEMQKVYTIESQKKKVQKQIDAYSQLDTYLNDISSASTKVDDREDFNMFNTSSTNDDSVKVSTSIGAQEGNYGVKVFQLAEREKMISKDGLIADNQADLSTLDRGDGTAIGVGTFKINGVEIELSATDTLEELRVKINSAKKDDGSDLGVTATVLKMSDNNYRFVLTSDDTGSEGATYEDVSGSVLQNLGILDASGGKGIVNQAVTSKVGSAGNTFEAAFNSLTGTDDLISFNGTDLNGETVAVNYVKGATDTIDDFLKFVESSFNGAVTATIESGNIVVKDKNGGNSLLNINEFDVGGEKFTDFDIAYGKKGSNVLSVGKDAFFSVDSINMTSDSNKASGFVKGVNFELKSVSYDKETTLTIDRDYGGLAKKVEDLINSYNAVNRYVETSTKYGNADDGESSGVLVGDLTAKTLDSQIRSVFMDSFNVSGTNTISSLAQIGIKTNTETGRYELDKEKFQDALEENFDEIVSLFVTEGYTDNSSIIFGTKTDDTQEGVYNITELADGSYQYTVEGGDGTVYNSTGRQGDVIQFDEGPAKGMYLTAPKGSGNAKVTFSQGLAGKLTSLVKKMTEAETGTLASRTNSMNSRISSYTDQAEAMERRVESYRERLVKQFAAMEQTMSLLQSQQTAMMSQLGYY